LGPQTDHAHAAVDQQITRVAADMPDVASVVFLDVRLVDPGDAVADRTALVPGLGRRDSHAAAMPLLSPAKTRRTCRVSAFFSRAIGISSRATNTMNRLFTTSNMTSPAVFGSIVGSTWPRCCKQAISSPT